MVISIFLVFTACNKDKKNTIHIEGKIFDPNTSEYISGVNVTIAASKLSSGGIFSSGFADIATAITDDLGMFTLTFKEEKFAGYQFSVIKDNYFEFVKEVSTAEIVPGTTFSPVFQIYPVCYVDLKIRNATPVDSNDFVTYSFTSGWLGGYQCCNSSIYQGSGEFYADTIFCKTQGNQYVTVTYNVRKEGVTLLYTQKKYCAAFDTTFFNFLY